MILQRYIPLMDIQLFISISLGLFAFLYMLRRIVTSINKTDLKPGCDGCDVKQDTIVDYDTKLGD